MTPRDTIKRIYGNGGLTKVARNLGVNNSAVSRWNREGWPDYAVAIVEWLEETPEKYWPERWKK